MAATYKEISDWFEEGKQKGSLALIVGTDTFSYDDYPVYCIDISELENKIKQIRSKSMSVVQEVYDLNKNKEEQMSQRRCFEGLKLLRIMENDS